MIKFEEKSSLSKVRFTNFFKQEKFSFSSLGTHF